MDDGLQVEPVWFEASDEDADEGALQEVEPPVEVDESEEESDGVLVLGSACFGALVEPPKVRSGNALPVGDLESSGLLFAAFESFELGEPGVVMAAFHD